MSAAREAWIIDGVRTPRGKGKPNGALHHLHPQDCLAQCLNALASADGRRSDDRRRRHRRQRQQRRRSRLVHRPPLGARRRLAVHDTRLHAQPLLRLGAAGGRRSPPWASSPACRTSWWAAVSSRCRAGRSTRTPTAPPTLDGDNPVLREKFPTVPQGISADLIATIEGFSRERVRRAGRHEPGARGQGPSPKVASTASVIPVRNPDGTVALDHDEFPRPGTTIEGLAKLAPSFEEMGRHRFDGFDETFDEMCAADLPGDRPSRRTSTTPATHPASSTAPPPCSSRPRTTPGPTASRPGPASA